MARDRAGELADRTGDAEGRRRGEPADQRGLQGAAHGRRAGEAALDVAEERQGDEGDDHRDGRAAGAVARKR